jgi:hypothetical protein
MSAIVANLHRIARHIHAHVVVPPGEEEENHAVGLAAEAIGRIGGDDEFAGARVVNAGGEFREALGLEVRVERQRGNGDGFAVPPKRLRRQECVGAS